MLERVEIIRVNSPSDFWIAQKNSEEFLRIMHNEISREQDSRENRSERSLNVKKLEPDEIIGVYLTSSRRWYRARIISRILGRTDDPHSAEDDYLKCYLVDTGEKAHFSRSNCCKLFNHNLQVVAPLAIPCSLFGIIDKNRNNTWTPLAIRFFHSLCDESNHFRVF